MEESVENIYLIHDIPEEPPTFEIKQEELDIKEEPLEFEQLEQIEVMNPGMKVLLLPEKSDCSWCIELFPDSNQLLHHLHNVHRFIKVFRCSQCPFYSTLYNVYYDHAVSLHKECFVYVCVHCDFHTDDYIPHVNHVIEAHEGFRDYKCSDCGLVFTKYKKLKNHSCQKDPFLRDVIVLPTSKSPTMLKCRFCSVLFANNKEIAEHIVEHLEKQDDFLGLSCSNCSITCDDQQALAIHKSVCRNECLNEYECEMCRKRFVTLVALINHMRLNHFEFTGKKERKIKGKINQKLLDCNKCRFSTCSRDRLQSHKLEHLLRPHFNVKVKYQGGSERGVEIGQTMYGCDKCDFKTRSEVFYMRHRVKHEQVVLSLPPKLNDSSPHCCWKCNKSFASEIALFNHNKVVHIVLR